jgi:hypothetical protein
MTIHTEQWESLASFLAKIAETAFWALQHTDSLMRAAWSGAADLPTFVTQCQTLGRADFAGRARTIDQLAETLAGELPAGVTLRRTPSWGRSGASVNVHKVLRGDLAHAWRRTTRAPVAAGAGDLVVLLPSVVAAVTSHEQLQWSAIATLALADYARRQGRRVELWSLGYFDGAYQRGDSYVACVPLMRAGQSWDMSAVALATYPEWLRRLGFRALELGAETHGALRGGYGTQLAGSALLAWARAQWAPAQHLSPESLMLGCSQEHGVKDRVSAERWVAAHLARLSAHD